MYIFLTEKYDILCNVKKQNVDSNTRWQEVFGTNVNSSVRHVELLCGWTYYNSRKLHWCHII